MTDETEATNTATPTAPAPTPVGIDQRIQQYVMLRDKIKEFDDAHKEKMKPFRETLEGLKDADGKQIVPGIFAAVPYCIDLIGGPYLETRDEVCKAFRPKTAIRPPRTA